MTDFPNAAVGSITNVEQILRRLAAIDLESSQAVDELCQIQSIFEGIPVEVTSLKQYSPIIALFRNKFSLLKSGIANSFRDAVECTINHELIVHTERTDLEQLWRTAAKAKCESSIVSELGAKVTSGVLLEILSQKSVGYSSSPTRWAFKPPTDPEASLSVGPICETLNSFFAFLPGALFPNQPELFAQFGRLAWLPFAVRLLKKFGPSLVLSNLESALLKIGLLPAGSPTRLITSYEESRRGETAAEHNRILGEIRSRLLADPTTKIVPTKRPEQLKDVTFFPAYVSLEAARMAKDFFEKNKDLVPHMISLFTCMRQTQFHDPRAVNPKAAAIFFNDCIYLSIVLASWSTDFKREITLLRAAGERSMAYFLKTLNSRIANRIASVGPKSFDLGLTKPEQGPILDKAIEGGLMELSACFKDWRAIKVDVNVCLLWITMIVDSYLKVMNRVAIETAKVAVKSTPVNTILWGLFRKFLNSVDMVLLKDAAAVLNSHKVARRIRTALSGSQADIEECTDPLPNDAQLFGISRAGFEMILQCNPLLQSESSDSIKLLADKLMSRTDVEAAPIVKEGTGGTENNYAALFSRV